MEKLKMHTPDLAEENYKKLAALFPDAVTETITGYDEKGRAIVERAIDKDVLMQEINAQVVDDGQERYQFTWPDKRKSVVLANAPIAKTLRFEQEKSVGRDGTPGGTDSKNIYIEGDNLDALKLLQETYLGKVKMIYIDPPYNTGNDFIYEDDFSIGNSDWSSISGEYDGDKNRLVQNSDANGRFHTDWLNMLYPRLRLAKDLLSNEGCIFVSIDEHEIDNCLKILDEAFGRNNRVGVIVVKSNPRGSMSIGEIANLHEYLVVYAKDINEVTIIGHKLTEDMENEYKYEDRKGSYRLLGLRMRGGFWRRTDRPNLYYPIYVNPHDGTVSLTKDDLFTEEALPVQPSTMEDGTWRWSTEKVKKELSALIAKQVKRGDSYVWDIYQKDYYSREGGRRTKAKSIWDSSEINYQNGATEVKNLLGSNIFDYSKIMVQLPEQTEKKSGAYKAGYKTICDIGEERIRRAGKKIKEETGADIDYGFRCFKVDSSNMKDVYYRPADIGQMNLDQFTDNIKEDRTPEDLLIQVMLDLGVLLSSKVEQKEIAGKKVFSVADGYLIACFDSDVTDDVVTAIAKQHPFYAVFRDSSMANDSVAANFEQIFDTYSPQTVRKVL